MKDSNVIYLQKAKPLPQGTPVTVLMFGDILKQHRKQKQISQTVLAEMLGVNRNTIVNWETDKIKPDFETLQALCAILEISREELFGLNGNQGLSADERKLLQNYRQLSDLGQRIAQKEVFAILEEEGKAQQSMLRRDYFIRGEYQQEYTAGEGDDYGDLKVEPIFVRRTPDSENADFIARVKGHSMEPAYMDGDRVYCKKAACAVSGQDVVCSMASGKIIKRVGQDNRTLFSVNPASEYQFKKKYDDDHLRIEGIVLGKVPASDSPTAEQLELLTELFSEELSAFRAEHKLYDE